MALCLGRWSDESFCYQPAAGEFTRSPELAQSKELGPGPLLGLGGWGGAGRQEE